MSLYVSPMYEQRGTCLLTFQNVLRNTYSHKTRFAMYLARSNTFAEHCESMIAMFRGNSAGIRTHFEY